MHLLAAVAVVISLAPPAALAAPVESDHEAARALAARARAQLDARRPEAAARLFELAHARAPHPLWLAAAGEAWLEALQPDPAVRQLEAALADAGLVGAAREHTNERLEVARKVGPLIATARTRGVSAEDALVAWREAFAASNLGRCLWEAARTAERARRFGDADTLYALAVDRDDLSNEERRAARDALVKLRERDAFARARRPEPPSTAGWVVVASGAAVLAGGVVAWIVGEDQRERVRSAMNEDGLSSRISRAEAQALERSANKWSTVGWVAAGVGVVAMTVGVVVIETRPVPRGAVITAKVSW